MDEIESRTEPAQEQPEDGSDSMADLRARLQKLASEADAVSRQYQCPCAFVSSPMPGVIIASTGVDIMVTASLLETLRLKLLFPVARALLASEAPKVVPASGPVPSILPFRPR